MKTRTKKRPHTDPEHMDEMIRRIYERRGRRSTVMFKARSKYTPAECRARGNR